MGRLEEEMDRLEEGMNHLEEAMDHLEGAMDRLETKMDRLETKMDRILQLLQHPRTEPPSCLSNLQSQADPLRFNDRTSSSTSYLTVNTQAPAAPSSHSSARPFWSRSRPATCSSSPADPSTAPGPSSRCPPVKKPLRQRFLTLVSKKSKGFGKNA